jgi:hypothetical protein
MLHFLLHTFFGGFLCGLAVIALLYWAIRCVVLEAIGRGLNL